MKIRMADFMPTDRKMKYVAKDLGLEYPTLRNYWYGYSALPIPIAKRLIKYLKKQYNMDMTLEDIYSDKYAVEK